MPKYTKKVNNVIAHQWDGTETSLSEIQDLIEDRLFYERIEENNILILSYVIFHKGGPEKLYHRIYLGEYIVATDTSIRKYTKKGFQQKFELLST